MTVKKAPSEDVLRDWIATSLKQGNNYLAAGYQGSTLLYEDDSHRLIIKAPHGHGISRLLNRRMLRHENEVYRHLQGHPNIAHCYGMIDETYLLLEYIDAPTARERPPAADSPFHDRLFEAICLMHERGVAHVDLKRKENILIHTDGTPVLIDFGVAVIFRPGFHILNHYLYDVGKRFDWNAWIKHKYQGKMEQISKKDLAYYDRTLIERLAKIVKSTYLNLKRRLIED